MKNSRTQKSLIILSSIFIMFLMTSTQPVQAEDTKLKPHEIRALREENLQKREDLRDENMKERQELRENSEQEREEFRTNTKMMLEGKTKEERKALRPTIIQQRKDVMKKLKDDRKALKDENTEERRSLFKSIRSAWENLRK